jgi:hypothetical protein
MHRHEVKIRMRPELATMRHVPHCFSVIFGDSTAFPKMAGLRLPRRDASAKP